MLAESFEKSGTAASSSTENIVPEDISRCLVALVDDATYSPAKRPEPPTTVRPGSSALWRVVVCDIGLHGMDGYAVARALRSAPKIGCITLVALTGYAAPEDVAKAREAGFDAHIAKPGGCTLRGRTTTGRGSLRFSFAMGAATLPAHTSVVNAPRKKSRAMTTVWTSSGPSAMRAERAKRYQVANGMSSL